MNRKALQKLFKRLAAVKITETRVVNTVFTLSPWLTPVITAWLVFNATQKYLDWGFGQALIAAIIIETNGVSSTNLLLYLYRGRAEKVLLQIAGVIVLVYAASVLFLTIALDTFPVAAKFSPILFVLLVLSSNATVAVRAHHKQVGAKKRKGAQDLDKAPVKAIDKPLPELDTRGKILAHFRQYPESTLADAGKVVGISRQRVGQLLEALETEGAIHRNGKVIVK